MKRTNYKLVIGTDVENEVIEVKLLESLNWPERPKYYPIVNLISITKISFGDIVDAMKQLHYKNIYWNFKNMYDEEDFINNYERIMSEQFDYEDDIEVDIDFIIENLLGIDVQKELAAHDELYEDLLELAQEIKSTLVNCVKYTFEDMISNNVPSYIYNSYLFDTRYERQEKRYDE